MKCLVWRFSDGRIQVTPVDPAARKTEETEAQQIERVVFRTQPALQSASGEKPQLAGQITYREYQDKYSRAYAYRGAWTWTTPEPVIDIDMAKAREIHRDILRKLRAPRLAALDVEFMRAIERGAPDSEVQEINAKKQALRDIPAHPSIESAQTPEELKAVTLP